MIIRRLEVSDYPLMSPMVEAQGASASFFWPSEALEPEVRFAEAWGLFVGPELAAFVLWRDLGLEAEITCILTSPERQGQGLAKRLLLEVFQSKPDAMWHLEVHAGNEGAKRLYEALGFQVVGRRASYYRDGGEALRMGRASWVDKPLL